MMAGDGGVITLFLSAQERRSFTRRSIPLALAWFLPEYGAWIAFTALAIASLPWPVSLASSILAGTFIGVVFTVGHDASHQALTPSRWLNQAIARLAFIPSAHAASLWDLGHNRIHHRFTNLLGADYVWEPMTPETYARAPRWRRALYRLYRSGYGHLPYYLIEMWWKKNFLPFAPETRADWHRHLFDSAFVLIAQALLVWAILAAGAAWAPERPWWITLGFGWLLPFLFWNWLMGLVIYMHHTHPGIGWLAREEDWSSYRVPILGCAEARMPGLLDLLDNNIMRHNAHHAFPAIPMYHLSEAQARLRAVFPETLALVIRPRTIGACVRACKLFDPTDRCWRDFDGRPTTPSLPLPPVHPPVTEATDAAR